jgi:23S rRNA (guanosine2251-2'-O)-methyltransferase
MKEFIYSRNAVHEALRARRRDVFRIQIAEGTQEKGRLADILQLAKERQISVERAPRAKLDKVHANHQGVVAEVSGYSYADVTDIFEAAEKRAEPLFVLLLDSFNDPQNLGALLRTAEAVGVHGIVIPLARTVEVTPAVVNASSGASEHLLIARSNLSQAIDALKEADAWIAGLDQNGQTVGASHIVPEGYDSPLQGALGLVVGSEGEGLHDLTRKKCDVLMKLPMQGQIESLNAAVAGSVALYLAYLARNK